MSKKLKHNQKLKAYVEQKKYFKNEYIKENGNAKGWFSSDEYKRINRNKKQYVYRRQRKIDLSNVSEFVDKKKLENIQDNEYKEIATNQIFYTVLSHGNGSLQNEVEEQFRRSLRKNKRTVLIIRKTDGTEKKFNTEASANLGMVELYNDCLDHEKKTGKYTLISSVRKTVNGNAYIIVEANTGAKSNPRL